MNHSRRNSFVSRTSLKKIDHWLCTFCEAMGAAAIDPHDDPLHAVARIRAAHARRSPSCTGGTHYLKLVSRAELDDPRAREVA